MEKKIWVRPEIAAVAFPANAYCAGCSISGSGYLMLDNGNNQVDYDENNGYAVTWHHSAVINGSSAGENSINTADYLTYLRNQINTNTTDAVIYYQNDNGSNTTVWENLCSGSDHTHTTDSSSLTYYSGWFASSSNGDVWDATQYSNTSIWTAVSIWFESATTPNRSGFHAVATAAHSA